MDLGFSRRSLIRSGAANPAFDYRMLLASVSARQAVSPTAKAQATIGRNGASDSAGGAHDMLPALVSPSFHADVASVIATESKSL
ncbi:MAG: hypothetical protein AABY88_10505 [Pseudomonadota bacterium]